MTGIEDDRASQKRIVVLVGKAGAGKSTVANTLSSILYGDSSKSHTFFKVKRAYDSVTEGIDFTEVNVDDPSQEERLTFRIVDTPGLFGTNVELTNPIIWEQIKTFFQEKAPKGVSLVLFVFSGGSGTRFTQEEKKVFDFLTKNFQKEILEASALVLTHCEDLTDEGRRNIVEDFKTNKLTKPFARCMGKGIYTVGFPDLKTSMLPQLQEVYKQTMENDQKELINLVFTSEKMYLGNEMFKKSFWEKLSECTIL